MKKWLAAIMAATMCVACFAGCGGAGTDSSKKKAKADSDDITITVWSGDGGGQATLEKLVDDWNSTTGEEKNIFINWDTSMDSQRTDVAQQNGTLPEITNANTTQIKKFVPTGDLIPLSDLPGGQEFLDEYDYLGVEGRNVFNGKQYSVWRKALTAGLIYNVDLFKKAGLVDKDGNVLEPKTTSELREFAKKLTDEKAGVYGYAFPLKFGLGYTIDAQSTASFNAEQPASKINYDDLSITYSGFKDRYQWILDMKKDGSLFPGAETLDNDTARAYFVEGKVAMFPAISWDVGVYTTQFVVEDFEWDVCETPIIDGHTEGRPYMSISGGYTVSKNALKTPEIAAATLEVYKFIYSLETRTALYEKGIDLSCKTDVIEAADPEKIDPRFAKFASYVDEDYKQYPEAGSYIVDGKSWGELFSDVWNEKITLDEAIADYEKRATRGLRDGVEKGTYNAEIGKANQEATMADWLAYKEKHGIVLDTDKAAEETTEKAAEKAE